MNPSAIKRKIIRDLEKEYKLTAFQKERINWEITSIRGDIEFAQHFNDYIKKNRKKIKHFLSDLDLESKEEMEKILENLDFMSNHDIVEIIENFMPKMGELMEHLNSIEIIRNKYKLPIEIHEEAIFKYKHGLNFIPNDVIDNLANKVFLDCGAYMGDSALVFEKDCNASRIYSFEPVPDNYKYLLDLIALNNLKKVIPIKKGLGEVSGRKSYSALGFCSRISENGNEEMEIITIDDFVLENKIKVGLIKMDLEGYEMEALNGAKYTIRKNKPILLISIYHNPEEMFESKNLIQTFVPDYNFKIKHLADVRPLGEVHLIAW
ncbi:MAG: FkbM family methyltransferase [Promethearchaeia archaeon]